MQVLMLLITMMMKRILMVGDDDDDEKNDGDEAVIDERPKSPIEKRKRNLIFFSPISRRERET